MLIKASCAESDMNKLVFLSRLRFAMLGADVWFDYIRAIYF